MEAQEQKKKDLNKALLQGEKSGFVKNFDPKSNLKKLHSKFLWRVELTSLAIKALKDLETIWLYTADKWSVDQADRYYNLIIDEINYICKNVNAGKAIEYIRKGYWASKVKSHLIFIEFQQKM